MNIHKKTNVFSILLIVLLLAGYHLNGQGFDYALQVSYSKFDYAYNNDPQIKTKGYYNGFQIGPLISFQPKKTILKFYSGVAYSRYYHMDYELNFFSLPIGMNFLVGKKIGVYFGGGIKLWYLMSIPERFFTSPENTNQTLISYSGQLGVFFKTNTLKYSIGPQIETFQTPIDESKYHHYLNMISLNLTLTW